MYLLFRAHLIIFDYIFGSVEVRHYNIRTTFEVLTLCNLLLQQFSFLFIQTLHTDSWHIED